MRHKCFATRSFFLEALDIQNHPFYFLEATAAHHIAAADLGNKQHGCLESNLELGNHPTER